MAQAHVVATVGDERVRGTIETTSWPLDASQSEVMIDLDDGRQVQVPFAVLSQREDNSYVLTLSPDELERGKVATRPRIKESIVFPVVTEELEIHKREVETGRVRITKVVHEREELMNEPLFREEVLIERVSVNRFVDSPIPVRYEGDTMIVSLLEEVAVVEKRLRLREELRITRRRVEGDTPLPVVLRREEATVEHIRPDDIDKKNVSTEGKNHD